VVPLFVGGGTRLKIYESMAAKVPVVSTRVGAEGLDLDPPDTIILADTASEMAEGCLRLLADSGERERIRRSAWEMVSERFSWEQVTSRFEEILEASPSTA
jgi:glycosyltransferase involved in cell wall biosynthesis